MKATIVLVAVVGLTVAGGAGAAVDGEAAESLAKRNGWEGSNQRPLAPEALRE